MTPFRWTNCYADVLTSKHDLTIESYFNDVIVPALDTLGEKIEGLNNSDSPGAVFASEHAVPRVLELPEADARERLTGLGFRVRLEGERANPAIPRGAVVWQDPPPDMVVPPNSTVQLVLSGGPAAVNVPDVVGLSLQFAEGVVEAAGMKVGKVDRVTSGQEADVVLSVRPAPGNARPRGSKVDLLVSSGRGGGQ